MEIASGVLHHHIRELHLDVDVPLHHRVHIGHHLAIDAFEITSPHVLAYVAVIMSAGQGNLLVGKLLQRLFHGVYRVSHLAQLVAGIAVDRL